MSSEYAKPDTLVSTDWVGRHKGDSNVRLVEVDVDTTAYAMGHIPGAVGWHWALQLCDNVRRDITPRAGFEKLCGESGIANDTTVILYGDNNNWFAAWAFWQFTLYGHKDVRLINGGRRKWLAENRETTRDVPRHVATGYTAREADLSIRAFREQVSEASTRGNHNLIDVRSPAEFSGQVIAPPGMTETAQRGGHIPGAKNIPWSKTVNEDGTFKTVEELRALYDNADVDGRKDTIAYCRIGERSSHTWFVLKCLLGYPNVRNYDGSWTEWGNLVGAPIERTAPVRL